MANKRLNIRGGLNIKASLSSGAGDPVLTRDNASTEVGSIPPVDTSSYLSSSLTAGQIYVGNNSNIAEARIVTGDITLNSLGTMDINNGSILNQHVANNAGILYSKLILTGGIVNSDINTGAAIDRTKIANGNPNRIVINNGSGVMSDNPAITINRVIVSDNNGLPIASGTTTTVLGYLDISSSLTALLADKLSFSGAISPNEGDLIQYSGGSWINLGIGMSGTVLTSDGTNASWQPGVSNGLPPNGTTGQYLRKVDNTSYNTTWDTLTVSKITDLTASAAELNILDGVTVINTEINFLSGVTSNVQVQLNNKLGRSLPLGYLFLGDAGGIAAAFAPGSDGQVLTSSGGIPSWQTPTPPGNVSGVAPSTDNAIVRWNGIGALSIQNSGIIIDDSNNVTGVVSLSSGQVDILNQAALRLHETGSTNYVGIRASSVMSADYTITLPAAAPATNTYLKYDGTNYVWDVASGGGGTVTSVNGTTDRITVSPTTGVTVVDIAATYVGQSSITTLGTITTGVWNGTLIDTAYTEAKVISVTGTTNRITISGTATDPVVNIASNYAGQVTITTLGTVTTGVWHGTAVGAIYGGTDQTSVTTGDLLYGSATNVWSKLAGVATGNVLISGGVATAPSWGKVTSAHVDDTVWKTAGNNIGGTGTIGSTSTQAVNIITDNTTRAVFGATGKISFSNSYNTGGASEGAVEFNQSATHSVASVDSYGMIFNGTVTAGANGQTLIGYLFKPTLNQMIGTYTGISTEMIRVQDSVGNTRFQMFESGSFTASTATNADNAFLFAAAGTGLLRLNSPASLSFGNNTSIKFGRMNELFAFTAVGGSMGAISTIAMTNLNYAFHSSSSWNGATNNSKHFSMRYNWTPTTGSNTITTLAIDPTINQTSAANGTVYGIDYNPTLTSLNGATHYGLLVRPTGALNGFGTGTPTATLHVVGTGLIDSNLRIGTSTDYIEFDRGSSWLRRVNPTVANFTILGDANTAGDGGSIFIQSGGSSVGLGGEIRLIPGTGATGFGRLLLGFNDIAVGESTDTTIPVGFFSSQGNSTTLNGQNIYMQASNAYSISGNGNGGNVTIQSGQRRTSGSGVDGSINIDPRTGFIDLKITATANASVTNTHTAIIKINGVQYRLLLEQV